MAYDITTTGIADFARLDLVVAKRKIAKDPLVGTVDGANKTFYTNYSPILTSGSLYVYNTAGSAQAGSADYDTGEITLNTAPTAQLTATYTFIPYTNAQQLSFLIQGFYEMEGRSSFGFRLIDASGVAANEDSTNIYLDYAGADPISNSPHMRAYFLACCRYAYLMAQLSGGAVTDYMWRETVRGMTVDKSKRPSNLALAVEAAERAIKAAQAEAENAFYINGENLGAFIGSPMTLEYSSTMEWQTAAENDDNRAQRGNRSFLPLSI